MLYLHNKILYCDLQKSTPKHVPWICLFNEAVVNAARSWLQFLKNQESSNKIKDSFSRLSRGLESRDLRVLNSVQSLTLLVCGMVVNVLPSHTV